MFFPLGEGLEKTVNPLGQLKGVERWFDFIILYFHPSFFLEIICVIISQRSRD